MKLIINELYKVKDLGTNEWYEDMIYQGFDNNNDQHIFKAQPFGIPNEKAYFMYVEIGNEVAQIEGVTYQDTISGPNPTETKKVDKKAPVDLIEQIKELQKKAKKWDKLTDGIAKIYEDENTDLLDIGEFVSRELGY